MTEIGEEDQAQDQAPGEEEVEMIETESLEDQDPDLTPEEEDQKAEDLTEEARAMAMEETVEREVSLPKR